MVNVQELAKKKDPITKLPLLMKIKKIYRPNPYIPKCKADELALVDNYDLAKKDNFNGWTCHHKLIGPGVKAIDLINEGVYYHRPATELIWLKQGRKRSNKPKSLHNDFLKKRAEFKSGIISEEEFKPYRDAWHEYYKNRDKLKQSKSKKKCLKSKDSATNSKKNNGTLKPYTKYKYALKDFKAGKISEDELEKYRVLRRKQRDNIVHSEYKDTIKSEGIIKRVIRAIFKLY